MDRAGFRVIFICDECSVIKGLLFNNKITKPGFKQKEGGARLKDIP
jgi:hypothetical protein